MSTEALVRKCHDLAGVDPETTPDADSLIGFFQVFRPDGLALRGLFQDVSIGEGGDVSAVGDELDTRVQKLFSVAGNDRRPQGGRDAYFVVRNPPPLDPDLARELGRCWLASLLEFAVTMRETSLAETLEPLPAIRVLEGIAPKPPKVDIEKSRLWRAVSEEAVELVDRVDAGPVAPLLRPAYYFTACDAMLRDYLMWPLYAEATGLDDPLEPYFQLWRHGVKVRIFGETQVDLYLPRQQD